MFNANMFALGKTYEGVGPTTGTSKHRDLLGETGIHDTLDYLSVSPAIKERLGGMKIKSILMRNDSGGTLAAGLFARLNTDGGDASNLYTVEGLATDPSHNAVLVDPFLSAAVPDGAIFNAIVAGVVPVTSSAAIAEDADIKLTAAGKVVTSPSGDRAFAVGRMIEAATGDAQLKLAQVYCRPMAFLP